MSLVKQYKPHIENRFLETLEIKLITPDIGKTTISIKAQELKPPTKISLRFGHHLGCPEDGISKNFSINKQATIMLDFTRIPTVTFSPCKEKLSRSYKPGICQITHAHCQANLDPRESTRAP